MSSSPSSRSFAWPVRVYYEDTDSGGVVYYANYLKFMERARTEWLRSLGVEQDALLEQEQLMFVVRSAQVEYNRAARFNNELLIITTLPEIRNVSFTFEHRIYLRADYAEQGDLAAVLCYGNVKVACLDSKTFRPRQVPSQFLMEIKSATAS